MRTSLFLHQSKVKNGLALNGILFYLSIPDKRIVDLVDALKYLLSKLPFITARLLAQVTGRIISICHLLCIGECPSNSPFLKNNGAEAHCFYGIERYENILQLKIHPLYFINCINY
jgi:hypothetical protein